MTEEASHSSNVTLQFVKITLFNFVSFFSTQQYEIWCSDYHRGLNSLCWLPPVSNFGCNGSTLSLFGTQNYFLFFNTSKTYIKHFLSFLRFKRMMPPCSYALNFTPGFFKLKSNAHSMCVQTSSLHIYHIENGYRITNVIIYNIFTV
jgi:hypothetical protein